MTIALVTDSVLDKMAPLMTCKVPDVLMPLVTDSVLDKIAVDVMVSVEEPVIPDMT